MAKLYENKYDNENENAGENVSIHECPNCGDEFNARGVCPNCGDRGDGTYEGDKFDRAARQSDNPVKLDENHAVHDNLDQILADINASVEKAALADGLGLSDVANDYVQHAKRGVDLVVEYGTSEDIAKLVAFIASHLED